MEATQAAAGISPATRNPLAALLDGVSQVIVATLQLLAALVRFGSVTLPSAIYTVLHYSFTLQLDFPSLAILFLSLLVTSLFWLRYRHLNRYERLQEVPLVKDQGFTLHPDVAGAGDEGERGGGFHNYLDEFLSAIRIFGFLEKPVFHELARHLQTRRVVAGDSLSLDSDFSFYIVIDGNMQVFAPLPPELAAVRRATHAADAEEEEDGGHSGYQLLNEVGSGSTLSSLFTILSLFTEDVRLGFAEGVAATPQDENGGYPLGGEASVRAQSSHGHPGTPASYPIPDPHVHTGLNGSVRRRSHQRPMFHSDELAAAAMANAAAVAAAATGARAPSHHQLRSAALQSIASTGPNMEAYVHAAPPMTEGSTAGTSNAIDSPTSAHPADVTSNHDAVANDESDTLASAPPTNRELSPGPNDLLPPARASAPISGFSPAAQSRAMPAGNPAGSYGPAPLGPHPAAPFSPTLSARGRTRSSATNATWDGHPRTPGSVHSGLGGGVSGAAHFTADPMHAESGRTGDSIHREGVGTVARATVDTTLAVIPAEAFKRLTKKFPNAAAHIVQVILARLSRVTLQTAHQYLGLTKEVMRTEKRINELACFPLPAEFYEQGGIERLRHRFLPEPARRDSTAPQEAVDADAMEDPVGPGMPGSALAGMMGPRRSGSAHSRAGTEKASASPQGSRREASASATANQREGLDIGPRWTSYKGAVGPGDLLSMTGQIDNGRRPTSPALGFATPRQRPRPFLDGPQHVPVREGSGSRLVDTESESANRGSGQANGNPGAKGASDWQARRRSVVEDTPDATWVGFGPGDLANFNLKEALMSCIARSIGLIQSPPGIESPRASVAASPFINPADAYYMRGPGAASVGGSGVFRNAFSNLSMLDVAMAYEEESSVTGGAGSSILNWGPHHQHLDNEVEVRFFSAGSTLAKAGEVGAGLFYIIDGFVDVIVPAANAPDLQAGESVQADTARSNAGFKDPPMRKSNAKGTAGQPRTSAAGGGTAAGGMSGRGSGTSAAATARAAGPSHGRLTSDRGDQHSSHERLSTSSRGEGTRQKLATPLASDRMGNALDGTSSKSKTATQRRSTTASAASRPGEGIESNRSTLSGRARRSGAVPDGGSKAQDNRGPTSAKTGPKPIYTVGRGGIAGYLSSLLGSASYVDIVAKTDTYVGFLPARALARIMERRPIVLLTLCKRLLSLLSPLIIHIDSALDWQHVNAGQVIYREGDAADSFYIVINGRLRAITERSGVRLEVLDEYGQGASVGELDVITQSPRRKTLHAIRDSEVARMPMSLFNAISARNPEITIQISRIIARRVRKEVDAKQGSTLDISDAGVPGLRDLGRNNENLRTVAILPVTREVPIADFATLLQNAFDHTIGGPTAYLNQGSVMGVLGRHAFNRIGKLKLAGWLAEQEQRYRLVMYVVDTPVTSPWAQTSIRQADCVLVVGFGDDPSPGEYERLLLSIQTTARKELVLLHPERSVPSGTTRAWLKTRPWINAHHHVEMPGLPTAHPYQVNPDPKAVRALRNLRDKLETRIQRYRGKASARSAVGRPHHFSDFARLSRRLCGQSIGLVLGGGGARGCAHVGFLRALEERGIPVDMVAGTSIGSLVGGLYAREAEVVTTYGRAKKFAGRMASLWRFTLDLTYPITSYTTGHEFNRGLFKAFGDISIEDFWLPFACNSVNITWSRPEIHVEGFAWRYIRASMTLAGLIPPLVDKGNMLLDGGYVDNLPVTVLRAMGAKHIFAVDVGSVDDTSPRSYGDTLSGFWVLINKWNPWSDARNIPSIPDIQGRLAYVSSVKTLEEAKRTQGVLYARMPVEGFGTLAFGQFNEIAEVGYDAASRFLDRWHVEGRLPDGFASAEARRRGGEAAALARRRGGGAGGVAARRNSI